VSNSVAESVEKKVLIKKLKTLHNPITINDSMSLFVQSAWLEYSWRYAGEEAEKAEIEQDSSVQIIIILDEKSLKEFNFKWHIRNIDNSSAFYGANSNLIVSRFNNIENDSLKFNIFQGKFQAYSVNENFLGEVIFAEE
jgi:ADP-glucose pyrophosphorylase